MHFSSRIARALVTGHSPESHSDEWAGPRIYAREERRLGAPSFQCSGLSAKPGTPTMAGLVITTWRRCQRRGSGNPATPGTWAEATISRGRYLSPFTQPQPWPSIRTAIIVYLLRDAQDVPVQFCQWTILLLLQVAAYNAILTSPTAFFTIIYEKFWYF